MMVAGIDLSGNGRYLLTVAGAFDPESGSVSGLRYRWRDLEGGIEQDLEGLPTTTAVSDSSGRAVSLGPGGRIYVVGGVDGTVYVGRVSDGEPHLLVGHRGPVAQVEVSPDGRWIASRTEEEIRLWPMPDLDRLPLHRLPPDELLATLRGLTNLRLVEDPASSAGWSLEIGPFPGWQEVPRW